MYIIEYNTLDTLWIFNIVNTKSFLLPSWIWYYRTSSSLSSSSLPMNFGFFKNFLTTRFMTCTKTWDVLVFLIILNTDININVLKQLFDNSFVWCIIYGDTEQILTQVEIYNHINDIIAKILLCIGLFERMECQETIMQLEFYINPIHSNYYRYISPKFICNVQNNFFKEWNNICTLWRGHYLDIELCF